MRGWKPYTVKLSALALFFVPLVNEGVPVLATAIDGAAEIIVSGDNDLRAGDALRAAMKTYDIQLLGVQSFLNYINEASE